MSNSISILLLRNLSDVATHPDFRYQPPSPFEVSRDGFAGYRARSGSHPLMREPILSSPEMAELLRSIFSSTIVLKAAGSGFSGRNSAPNRIDRGDQCEKNSGRS